MEELFIKHRSLIIPRMAIVALKKIKEVNGMTIDEVDLYYRYFKSNISLLGLEPSEYQICIKWFCDTMEY